jgi:hypothetical protein
MGYGASQVVLLYYYMINYGTVPSNPCMYVVELHAVLSRVAISVCSGAFNMLPPHHFGDAARNALNIYNAT